MNIKKTIKNPYVLVIVLMSLIAFLESVFSQGKLPYGILVAVIVAVVLDISAKKLLGKRSSIRSAIITGIIIGSILPKDSHILLVIAATIIAMASKHLIKLNKKHVFNPAAFGLLLALYLFNYSGAWWIESPHAIFSHYEPEMWFVETSHQILGHAVILTPLLALATAKIKKLRISIAYLASMALLHLLYGLPVSITSLPYFFALVMAPEPKTSPIKKGEQVIYGLCLSVATFFAMLYGMKSSLLISLLSANLLYAVYRKASSR